MMMLLGDFIFELKTAAFQQLQRQTPQRWSEHGRVGQTPAYQHLGPGNDDITLPGVIFPEMTGWESTQSLHELREMSSTGKPHTMISDNVEEGFVLGNWIILSVDENQSNFLAGSPRKIEFTVKIRRYSETDLFEYWLGGVLG